MSIYLVTGANRGIGFGFVQHLSQNPKNTVIAAVRDKTKAKAIQDLKASNVHIIELTITDEPDTIAKSLKAIDSITDKGIDVLIQNAGVMPVSENPTDLEDIKVNTDVNYYGPVKVYNGTVPYLYKSDNGVPKKVVFLTSFLGSSSVILPFRPIGYGAAKAALNFFTSSIADLSSKSEKPLEKNSFITAVHPGVVITDLTAEFQNSPGSEGVPFITVDESVSNILSKVVDAKSPEHHGKMVNYDGTVLPF